MNGTGKGLVLALLCSLAVAELDSSLDQLWDMWKTRYGKKYLNKVEEVNRRAVWEKNVLYINNHNLKASMGKHTYTLAMNHMGDLTKEEILQRFPKITFPKSVKRTSAPLKATTAALPDSVDWRERGGVTPVKNQGLCGSWAFSAVGVMEGHHFTTTGKLVALSEQQLIDCALGDGDLGCQGGNLSRAFEYISEEGLEAEDHYPYEGKFDVCRYNPKDRVAKCSQFKAVANGSEAALKFAVASFGPVSVGIRAEAILFYHRGIFSCDDKDPCINHALLAVGYGQEEGKDFWLLKNSWGTDWGEHGYIRVARDGENTCGVATYTTFCAA